MEERVHNDAKNALNTEVVLVDTTLSRIVGK